MLRGTKDFYAYQDLCCKFCATVRLRKKNVFLNVYNHITSLLLYVISPSYLPSIIWSLKVDHCMYFQWKTQSIRISELSDTLENKKSTLVTLKFIYLDHIYPLVRAILIRKAFNFISSFNAQQKLFIAPYSFLLWKLYLYCYHELQTISVVLAARKHYSDIALDQPYIITPQINDSSTLLHVRLLLFTNALF